MGVFEEHFGNMMGTNWELDGNIVRLHWDQIKNNKSPPSHWLHEISTSKIICHHFQLALITVIINWGTYWEGLFHFIHLVLFLFLHNFHLMAFSIAF